MITDRYGYLWITTPKGVARYNGYDFKFFSSSEGLPYEDIWELLEDKKGRIWLGNISDEIGYIYNNKYHKAVIKNTHGTIYPRNIQKWEDGIVFWSYYVSGDDQISVCKEDNDTFHIEKITKALFTKEEQEYQDSIYHSSQIEFFFINTSGEVYAIYGSSLYKINIKEGVISTIKKTNVDLSFLPEKNGRIRVFQKHILTYLENKINVFKAINYTTNKVEIVSLEKYGIAEPIQNIYQSKDENTDFFYVITSHHILQFQEKDTLIFVKEMPGKKINGADITAYSSNFFWGNLIGTTNKGLFLENNYYENHFKKAKNINIAKYKYVGGIPDLECFWWNSQLSTLMKIENRKKITHYTYNNIPSNIINKIIPYSNDTLLYLGVTMGYVDKKSKATVIDKYWVQDAYSGITLNKNEIFLISSNGLTSGKIIFDEASGKLGLFSHVLDPDRYRDIIYDSLRKNTWAYNYNKILILNGSKCISITSDEFSKFGVKKIESITIDNKYGNIFFKGQNNITIYNPESNTYQELFKNFNLKESFVYVYKNTLITIGRFGIIFNKILGPNKISKPLLYANIKNINYNYIYDCQVSWGSLLLNTDKETYEVTIPNDSEIINNTQDSQFKYNVILNYRNDVFNIKNGDTVLVNQKDSRLQFDIINPQGNGQLKYTYRFPNDTAWHDMNSNELILSATLSPDSYYKITIEAHDNVWRSDDLDIYLYIVPHWWQTQNGKRITWLSAIVLVLLLFTIAILITRILVLRATKKRNLQMELELKSIYAQINPHFIFNTLNSALLLVSKNRMEEAYIHIAKFSRLLRSYIKSSRNKLITIAEEITNLKNYIELQQTRFRDKFEYSIIVDESINAEQVKIPSLLLQPFVENAINHGVLNKPGEGKLSVSFNGSNKKNEIICVIEDDGVGRKNSKFINESNISKDESYGDLLIKDLVSIFNKYEQMNIEISYIDKEEPLTGTIVTIHIKKP